MPLPNVRGALGLLCGAGSHLLGGGGNPFSCLTHLL